MNSTAILRTLITYAICVPLAIVVGYVSTWAAYAPTRSNYGVFGMLMLVMSIPFLLRWHYFLLVLSWNFSIILFFLPGRPTIWLAALRIGCERPKNQR